MSVRMYTTYMQFIKRPEEDTEFSELEYGKLWVIWFNYWESNSGLLQEQQAFLPAEPPLHPLNSKERIDFKFSI